MKPRILVIDDVYGASKALSRGFARTVDPRGHCDFTFVSGQVDGRNSLPAALSEVARGWPHREPRSDWAMVLLDVQFAQRPEGADDGRWGFRVLSALRTRWPDLPVVMLTSLETAKREASWSDADGFLPKPDAEDAAAAQEFLRRLYSFGLFPDMRTDSRLAGTSMVMLRVLQDARRFACDPLGSGRILYGETGTGKTELARFIHDQMGLLVGRTGGFQSWSAAGADEGVTKVALFGHWRGAFTGSTDDSAPGAIERSHGGTFFLDEVASLTPIAQALFIETRRRDARLRRLISRTGKFPTSSRDRQQAVQSIVPGKDHLQPDGRIAVDVVMLTASNVNLHDEEVADAVGFRRDLLNDLGAPLYLPALNDRREDIPAIFEQIVAQIGTHLRRSPKQVDPRVFEELKGRDWTKKNIVALRQIAEHAVLASRDFDEILVRHLPPPHELRRWAGDRPAGLAPSASPPTPRVSSSSPPPRATSIAELVQIMESFEAPADAQSLEGALPPLQRAYARLVLRLLGATLRATRTRLGVTQRAPAVRHLLGLNPVHSSRANGDQPPGRGSIASTTVVYDIISRISDLCDVYFGANDEPVALLSQDGDVTALVTEARAKRRSRSPLVPDDVSAPAEDQDPVGAPEP